MTSELKLTLPTPISECELSSLDSAFHRLRHVDSTKTDSGVATLGFVSNQPSISVFPPAYNSKLWKNDWYNQPATSVVLLTRLSDGFMYQNDTETITELGYGDALVFNAPHESQTGTLHPIRAKGFLSFPKDRRSTKSGSGPATLSLAHSAQYAMGVRGKVVE